MSNIVPAKSSLQLIATCIGQRPADTPRGALEHAIGFLAGAYGSLFQPPANIVPAWHAVLFDASEQEIADATLDHVRDTAVDDSGRLRGKFPPSPVDLLRRIRDARDRRARESRALQEFDEFCLRLAGMDAEAAYRECANRFDSDGKPMSRATVDRLRARGIELLKSRGEAP